MKFSRNLFSMMIRSSHWEDRKEGQGINDLHRRDTEGGNMKIKMNE